MRQDDLAPEILLLHGHLGLGSIHRQRADMSGQATEILGLHAAHGEDCTSDCLVVHDWKIVTCQDDVGEDQTRVRGIWPNLCLAVLVEGSVDPFRHNHGDHHCHSLVILGEVDRVGDYVSALRDVDGSVLFAIHDFGAILLDSAFQLEHVC